MITYLPDLERVQLIKGAMKQIRPKTRFRQMTAPDVPAEKRGADGKPTKSVRLELLFIVHVGARRTGVSRFGGLGSTVKFRGTDKTCGVGADC
jgi:hypothetical protein